MCKMKRFVDICEFCFLLSCSYLEMASLQNVIVLDVQLITNVHKVEFKSVSG